MPTEPCGPAPTGRGARRAVVLGDLVLDCVIVPDEPLRRGTDVAGQVRFRQGGSAATTARWLARSGVETSLVTALGDDRLGHDLETWLGAQGVAVRAVRLRGATTGRLGVLVEGDGERTFVADRGAILRLRPAHLRAAWFAGAALLHLPGYSLLTEPLASAAALAAAWTRDEGGWVSVDLASSGFLERYGAPRILERVAALEPAVVLATEAEATSALGGRAVERLLEIAPLVVVKSGPAGATAFRRDGPPLAVRPRRARVRDSTGAGDAFDAGFLAARLAPAGASRSAASLAACLRAGHTAARAEITGARPDPLDWLARDASAG